MQNELITVSRNQGEDFRSIMDNIIKKRFQETAELFASITTFDDLKTKILMGNGDSKHTYRTYMTAVKQFWYFREGEVLTAGIGDIEAYFDSVKSATSDGTAAARMIGLKRFYTELEKRIPFYESPFKDIPEKLRKKFAKKDTQKGIQALGLSELKRVLSYLAGDTTEKGLRNFAAVDFTFNTGLRAEEVSSLTWGDFEYIEDKNTRFVNGIGKGSKPFHQPVLNATIESLQRYHWIIYHCEPAADHRLFLSLPTTPHPDRRPITPNSLWQIFNAIGEELRTQKILTRQITFSPHLGRRSYCTILHDLGMSPAEIKELSRHSSYDVLMKHYLKVTPDVEGVLGKALKAEIKTPLHKEAVYREEEPCIAEIAI